MALRPDIRVDVWYNYHECLMKAQVLDRSSEARLNIEYHERPGLGSPHTEFILQRLIEEHAETLNWLMIGLPPMSPHEIPRAITFECLRATTKYLNEPSKETKQDV